MALGGRPAGAGLTMHGIGRLKVAASQAFAQIPVPLSLTLSNGGAPTFDPNRCFPSNETKPINPRCALLSVFPAETDF